VLELTQTQEGLLQFFLSVVDSLVQFVPSTVHVGQRFLDGSSLLRCGVVRQIVSLSKEN
jgi:hypothetical protein